ncbi:integrase catalytic domain-containing protein [Trichonephila clavipes]|nr:integrase catalytic domain-containing protein [Trichonephila clavipes]
MLPVLGKKAVLEWCMEEGLIGSTYVCPKCGKSMELKERTDDEGRYIVSIPWIEGNEKLEDHYSLAKGRLEKTVKTLKFTGRLIDYEQVFVDWEKEGIIEKIAQDEPKIGGKFHYMPHRPVFKEISMTKICPVFDGSAHHRKSCSLNDCVEKRPNLIGMIRAILNRFRLGKFGVISDIRKAFLQILMHENDMNFLPFLWWEGDNSEKAVIYRHRRGVFEVSYSLFLLTAVNHHFKQAPEHLEKAAEKLIDSMFVDNCVAIPPKNLNLFKETPQNC